MVRESLLFSPSSLCASGSSFLPLHPSTLTLCGSPVVGSYIDAVEKKTQRVEAKMKTPDPSSATA